MLPHTISKVVPKVTACNFTTIVECWPNQCHKAFILYPKFWFANDEVILQAWSLDVGIVNVGSFHRETE